MSWKLARLAEICEIKLGKTPSRSDKSYWDDEKLGSNVWVSIADLTKLNTRFIADSKEYITDKGASLFKPVKAGTLLMSFKLSIGKLAYANCDLYTNEAIVALPIKDKNKINSDFLFYFLHHYDWDKETENDVKLKGKTLNKTKLNEIEVPLPPLVTQQEIVSKLDIIFAEIDKSMAAAVANAKNAEALFQSYLDKLFEQDETVYKKVNIKDVCKIGDGNHSSKYPKKDEMVESGVPFIRSTNIVNGVLSDKDLVYLTESKHKELKKGHLKSGDVLITNRGEIGKVAIVDERFDNANLNSQIAWLRCHPTLINQYLLFFLMSANMKSFYSDTKTGAALQQLPIGKIEKIQVPLPSIDAQIMRCSEFLNVQQKSLFAISCYKNKIYQLTQLKKSILTRAFNGELVKE